jgi:hypothetical protein
MSLINKPAMYTAIAGGICLLIAGLTGAAAWGHIRDVVKENVTTNTLVMDIFSWMIIIAGFGGFAVIGGGLLIGRDIVGVGKFLIALGAGMGLIGFIIALAVWGLNGGSGMFTIGGSIIGLVGIILSIVARSMAN